MVDKKQKPMKEKKISQNNINKHMEKVSKMRNEMKTFTEKFQSDVKKKKESYQSFAIGLRKKKPSRK